MSIRKNRALRAVDHLRQAGSSGIHSFDLAKLLGTNFSPRAVNEARKMGYSITDVPERKGRSWGVRYVFHDTLQEGLQKSKYIFDPKKQVFVYS